MSAEDIERHGWNDSRTDSGKLLADPAHTAAASEGEAAGGLSEDEREALVEAIYQGRLRNCAETIEGWGKGGHGLLMRILRGESERFVADAAPVVERILAARAAQPPQDTVRALERVEALGLSLVDQGHESCLRINCSSCVRNDIAARLRAAIAGGTQ